MSRKASNKPGRGRNGQGNAIQAVERAARFLSLFSAGQPELTLNEITERLGLSRPTVHRYGMSLRSTGLIRYDPQRATYSLGPRIIELGRIALVNLSIVRLAQPIMERLSAETNETVVMSIWDGQAPVVVEAIDRTERLVSVSVRAGSRLPLFTSAQGLVFLAFSESAREAHASSPRLRKLGPQLKRIREERIAVSDGVIPGITVFAVPVFADGDVAATLALVCNQASGPAGTDSPATAALRRAATEIIELLGAEQS